MQIPINNLNEGDRFVCTLGERRVPFEGTLLEKQGDLCRVKDDKTDHVFQIISGYAVWRRLDVQKEIHIEERDGFIMRWFKKLLALGLVTFSIGATDLKFVWDPNPEPGVAYRLYQSIGTNVFVPVVEAGIKTEATLTNVDGSIIHRFFVTAISPEGFESLPSNIVTVQAPNPPTGLKVTAVITISIPVP